MIPNKELQELAQALKRSSEYTEMMQIRRQTMEHPRLGRLLMMFEREQKRIFGSGLQQAEIEQKLKKLYDDYQTFLDEPGVKKFMESAHSYQKMIGECMSYLNKSLDISSAY